MRQTTNIRQLIETINARNAASTCSEDTRDGWNSMLEHVLHAAGVYVGFGYLTEEQVPTGHRPGIRQVDGKNTFPDESRRFYYTHHSLKASFRTEV